MVTLFSWSHYKKCLWKRQWQLSSMSSPPHPSTMWQISHTTGGHDQQVTSWIPWVFFTWGCCRVASYCFVQYWGHTHPLVCREDSSSTWEVLTSCQSVGLGATSQISVFTDGSLWGWGGKCLSQVVEGIGPAHMAKVVWQSEGEHVALTVQCVYCFFIRFNIKVFFPCVWSGKWIRRFFPLQCSFSKKINVSLSHVWPTFTILWIAVLLFCHVLQHHSGKHLFPGQSKCLPASQPPSDVFFCLVCPCLPDWCCTSTTDNISETALSSLDLETMM